MSSVSEVKINCLKFKKTFRGNGDEMNTAPVALKQTAKDPDRVLKEEDRAALPLGLIR